MQFKAFMSSKWKVDTGIHQVFVFRHALLAYVLSATAFIKSLIRLEGCNLCDDVLTKLNNVEKYCIKKTVCSQVGINISTLNEIFERNKLST